MKEENNKKIRPPVVVIMGHVDHGKSTLLDYIRKTNVVGCEAGGITQCISAYEVSVKDENKNDRLITFLDTPGHEAFSKMRARGAEAADIAILIVSAEDSVKAQTIEAYNTIIESGIPCIVAINKIDRPNANIEKTKMDLIEKGIYLEGLGGDIPYVLISAKEGTGISDLLNMIILFADMQDFTGNPQKNASGIIIESQRNSKRGIEATCIIKDGTLKSGMFVATSNAIVNTRILENFLGKQIKEVSFSSPIKLVGFNKVPEVGDTFQSFNSKKEAEKYIKLSNEIKEDEKKINKDKISTQGKVIPIIIKTDVLGTIEAIEKEIEKLNNEEIAFKIIGKGVGTVNESDIKLAGVDKESIVIGFNTKIDSSARDLNESLGIEIKIFDIIYKLVDWLKEIIENRRPRQEITEVTGSLKVLKTFGSTKDKKVVGGKVINGKITSSSKIKIIRRENELGTGKISELQMNKMKTREVTEGSECGLQVETKIDIAPGDILEAFELVIK